MNLQNHRTIQLTHGQVTLVDESDFEWLNQWKWRAYWNISSRCFYALRTSYWPTKAAKADIRMHRLILGLKAGDPRQGDHINPSETLDNRRANLRIATPAENSQNKRTYSNNKSGYKGVSLHGLTGKWQANISANGKSHHLGLFSTPELAHEKRLSVAAILHGEFARESPRGR